MKICIDPGHGGIDPGALGHINSVSIQEKNINLKIALFLEQILVDLGHQSIMTRRIDRSFSLASRSNFANNHSAELFISIHCNSAGSSSAEGIETWIYPSSSGGIKFAEQIQANLLTSFPRHKKPRSKRS